MSRKLLVLVFTGIMIAGWTAAGACAEVVIKVRALNPLDTAETAVINYPLPKEISQEDILRQKITYSLDHSEDEEPPKSTFNVSFNEDEGEFFIDDEVYLLPKEVVTLEVHVQDVWTIETSQIDGLRQEVDGLLQLWEEEMAGETADEEKTKEEETRDFALMMKEEIIKGLDEILERQSKNRIIDVGVERHIAAYNDNIDKLRQVQQDIVLLANLIQFEGQELEEELPPEEGAPAPDGDQEDEAGPAMDEVKAAPESDQIDF